jgi:hypothetical protein
MWRLIFAGLLVASPVLAQEQMTAYQALKVVGSQFNRAALSRVISVSGTDGDPQPTSWRVVIADRNAPGGVRELEVAERRIVRDGAPSGPYGPSTGNVIKTNLLNLDSSGAFSVANFTADKSHTNFDSISYTLRSNDRGIPVWVITLHDAARRNVGTIYISASRGNVTRVEGMYTGRNTAPEEGAPPPADRTAPPQPDDLYAGVDDSDLEADESDENPVKTEIKRMFRRTKRDAQRMFERVRSSFDDFIRRE